VGAVFHQGPFELTADAYQIDIKNRIVLSENILGTPTGSPTAVAIFGLLNPPGTSGIGGARFFINGVQTSTKGLDIVGRYHLETDSIGRFDFTAAANFNSTKVKRVPTTAVLSGLPVPPILFDRGNRLTFEEGTPKQKHVLSVDWTQGAYGVTAKATYYGDVLIPNNAPSLDYHAGAHTLVDLEARYQFPMGLGVAIGANNLFDEYPNATPIIVNSNGPIGFPSYSPFGFNGRFLYARLSYNW
jgi:iron complex outermembrane receptor protein